MVRGLNLQGDFTNRSLTADKDKHSSERETSFKILWYSMIDLALLHSSYCTSSYLTSYHLFRLVEHNKNKTKKSKLMKYHKHPLSQIKQMVLYFDFCFLGPVYNRTQLSSFFVANFKILTSFLFLYLQLRNMRNSTVFLMGLTPSSLEFQIYL